MSGLWAAVAGGSQLDGWVLHRRAGVLHSEGWRVRLPAFSCPLLRGSPLGRWCSYATDRPGLLLRSSMSWSWGRPARWGRQEWRALSASARHQCVSVCGCLVSVVSLSVTKHKAGSTSQNTSITSQNTAITSNHKHHKHHKSERNDHTTNHKHHSKNHKHDKKNHKYHNHSCDRL